MYSLLIVDDDHHVLQVLITILSQAGHRCRGAGNVAQAQELLAEQPFDLLLTDLDMPGESGIDLIHSVKGRYPDTAVVIASVLDDPRQVRDILELGIYGYIVKPFTKNLVLITIENALQRHRLELKDRLHTRLLEREVAARTRSLDEQLHFLQTLIDAIPVPIYYKNLRCVYLGCNRSFERSVSLRREEIVGKTVFDIYPPDVAEELHRRDLEILDSGEVQIYERERRHVNGSRQWGIIHKAIFADSAGSPAGIVGAALDVTGLKRAEESLRFSEEKLRSLMDSLHIGVMTFNEQWELVQINRQMHTWFPLLRETAGPVNLREFLRRSGQPHGGEQLVPDDLFRVGKVREMTVTLETVGVERIFRTVLSPILNKSGSITEAVGLLEDITDRLVMERDLNQAQKLESIGQLAAGIAHEINTPAQFIGSNIGFLDDAFHDVKRLVDTVADRIDALAQGADLRASLDTLAATLAEVDWPYLNEEIPAAIGQSREGINRITTIVQAMKEFSHPSGKEKVEYDLNKLIETTIIVARNEWKYSAEVQTDLAADLPPVRCLADELGQVFLNILVNAVHAIESAANSGARPGKGTIVFTTRRDGPWVEVRIADTGSGIPEAIQDRIFDPFFTTKGVGKGTGQGLAISRDVVANKHGGSLTFTSKAGEGTVFVVRLPTGATE